MHKTRVNIYDNLPFKVVGKKFDAAGWVWVDAGECYLSPCNNIAVTLSTYFDAAGIERILDCYKYDGIFSLDWFLSFR